MAARADDAVVVSITHTGEDTRQITVSQIKSSHGDHGVKTEDTE